MLKPIKKWYDGRLEGDRLDPPQHLAPGVVRGTAVGQLPKPPSPGFLRLGTGRHPDPILHPAEHRAPHDPQPLIEVVQLVPGLAAGSRQLGEIRARVEQLR